jgi:hypothetical protein
LVFDDGVLRGGFLVDNLVNKGCCGYGMFAFKSLNLLNDDLIS